MAQNTKIRLITVMTSWEKDFVVVECDTNCRSSTMFVERFTRPLKIDKYLAIEWKDKDNFQRLPAEMNLLGEDSVVIIVDLGKPFGQYEELVKILEKDAKVKHISFIFIIIW